MQALDKIQQTRKLVYIIGHVNEGAHLSKFATSKVTYSIL